MEYKEMADVLKAVGEETRLKIMAYLIHDTFCVCELVELLEMSQPSISQHLRRLKEVGIILEEKRGKWTYYAIKKDHPLYGVLTEIIAITPSKESKIQALTENGARVVCD